jgi:hypothetical protein
MRKIELSKRYAHRTDVKPERSRMEIESTLRRFGASGFGYAVQGRRAQLIFEANGRRIRFDLPDPREALKPYVPRPTEAAIDQEERRLWRSLLMAIKSKLDVVESGISTFEFEFLPYTLMPTGQTFAEASQAPAFQEALAAGNLPPMLPGSR